MQRLQEVVRRAEMSQGGGMKLAQQLTAMEVRHEGLRHTPPLSLPCISPISPLPLPYISPISPCISLYLPRISAGALRGHAPSLREGHGRL